jgi:hypothetical protein
LNGLRFDRTLVQMNHAYGFSYKSGSHFVITLIKVFQYTGDIQSRIKSVITNRLCSRISEYRYKGRMFGEGQHWSKRVSVTLQTEQMLWDASINAIPSKLLCPKFPAMATEKETRLCRVFYFYLCFHFYFYYCRLTRPPSKLAHAEQKHSSYTKRLGNNIPFSHWDKSCWG